MAMPTRKTKRNRPIKKKSSRPARINLNQLRKKIDALKKKFEREQSKARSIGQRSNETESHARADSQPHAIATIAESRATPRKRRSSTPREGRRELARKEILAKIAKVRNELAARQADSTVS
jgi:hypothetical protein